MNNQNLYINTAGLIEIANSINLKKQEIMNIYNTKVIPILNSSDESLRISGLDTKTIINTFSAIFNQLDERLSLLTNILTNQVAHNYDEVSIAIKNLFDNNFASELKRLLGL